MINHFSPITLGKTLCSVNVAGFDLTETTHQPNHRLRRHEHELANIAFTIDGSFTETLHRHRFECTSQSIVIKPAGEAHANEYGTTGARCFLIEVQPERLEALHPLSNLLNRTVHLSGTMLSLLALRIRNEMRLMDTASLLAIEALTLELIVELSRSSCLRTDRKVPRWLTLAKEILHDRSSESITLADVAKQVDIHPIHLAREFRKFYRCTLGEYLRGLRVQFAFRELSSSDMPLVEVALGAGFADQAHFSRVFKRYTGMTPTEFRALNRIPR
jgi:AraC family transcriptional regulator